MAFTQFQPGSHTIGSLGSLTTSETITSADLTAAAALLSGPTVGASTVNVGTVIKLHGMGTFRTNSGSQTLEMAAFVGGTNIATTGAVTMQDVSSAQLFEFAVWFRYMTVGATGTVLTSAFMRSVLETSGTVNLAGQVVDVTATVATTTANVHQVGFAFGTANASNTLTVYEMTAEQHLFA